MMSSQGRARAIALALGAIAFSSLAFAAVVPRDMNRQLELIDAANGGIVVYGTIQAANFETLDDPDVPWTVMTVKVEQALGGTDVPAEVTVYSPGYGEHRLSISPPETETRVGEKVVMFLAANPVVRAHAPDAFKVDSFAEIFRTQTNRKGQVIVLGEGANFAVANNTLLTQVATTVKAEYDAIAQSAEKNNK